jgi:hypothetical protein
MVRSPVDICLGTSPIHAEKSRSAPVGGDDGKNERRDITV